MFLPVFHRITEENIGFGAVVTLDAKNGTIKKVDSRLPLLLTCQKEKKSK